MTLLEAAKQALEALENVDGIDTETECVTIDVGDVITALRKALEQPVQQEPCQYCGQRVGHDARCMWAEQQEPVAWMHTNATGHVYFRKNPQDGTFNPVPLYTRHQAREWVSAWMIQRDYATGHGETIEDMLKELEWQARESEREACATDAEWCIQNHLEHLIPERIRARGESK